MRRDADSSSVGWPYRSLRPVAIALNSIVGRARIEGLERVPRAGGAILAANHLTNWDPLFIMAHVPRPVHWLGQELVLRGSPARRWFFREVGVIPVDRTKGGNDAAVEEAIRRVRDGRLVGIFPEGKESPDPLATLPPRSGVGRIALATGAPIVPCAVRTEKFWPYGKDVPRFRGPNFVRFGEPFRVAKREASADDRAVARLVAEEIFDRVREIKRGLDRDVAAALA